MAAGEEWTREELRASVDAYLEMFSLHRAGRPFVKKQYYRDLAQRFGRTDKAFEYRVQNISQVLALQGREWLPGLVPAKNVGTVVIARIEDVLAEAEGVSSTESAAFASEVDAARKRKNLSKPLGNKVPTTRKGTSTTFVRDPEVKAWVLNEAKGVCESCEKPAPFLALDGDPYLEAHHVRRLADRGSDTVENAVAICPNCHRALHHSIARQELIGQLYKRVKRLVRE